MAFFFFQIKFAHFSTQSAVVSWPRRSSMTLRHASRTLFSCVFLKAFGLISTEKVISAPCILAINVVISRKWQLYSCSERHSTMNLSSLNVDVLLHLIGFVKPVDCFNLALSGILKGFGNINKGVNLHEIRWVSKHRRIKMGQSVCEVRLQRPPWMWWELRTWRALTLKRTTGRCSHDQYRHTVAWSLFVCIQVKTQDFTD